MKNKKIIFLTLLFIKATNADGSQTEETHTQRISYHPHPHPTSHPRVTYHPPTRTTTPTIRTPRNTYSHPTNGNIIRWTPRPITNPRTVPRARSAPVIGSYNGYNIFNSIHFIIKFFYRKFAC